MNTMTHSDCIAYLRTLPDASVDSCVTDPPYELGFMGKKWDSSGIAYSVELWREVLRALKPGAHLLAFGGTRTHHRMVCAIEDAGFEIRDEMQWLYGSGFPKSLDVSKAIDKAAGAERDVVGKNENWRPAKTHGGAGFDSAVGSGPATMDITAPATDAAKQWDGWGTALKPACEPICVARKPLCGTVAANVLAHGTGALNVDGCRIKTGLTTSGPTATLETWEQDQNLCALCAADAEQKAKPSALETGASIAPRSAAPTLSEKAKLTRADTDKTGIGCSRGLYPEGQSGSKTGDLNLNTSASGGNSAENFPQATSSTTSTETDSTTGLKTCSQCGAEIIAGCTQHKATSNGRTKPAQKSAQQGDDTNQKSGRWPSNCLLSHAEGCVCTGTKRVKGTLPRTETTGDSTISKTGGLGIEGGRPVGFVTAGHADADGLETVEAWQCVEGCPVRLLDAQSGESKSTTGVRDPNGTMGYHGGASGLPGIVSGHSDTGGASRFFYTAKASKSDREHFNTHATVKPLALMRYLVRLVTPPGGVVLDMFAGSGTTLVAARQEGFRFLGCDADEGHVRIAQDRLALELPFET